MPSINRKPSESFTLKKSNREGSIHQKDADKTRFKNEGDNNSVHEAKQTNTRDARITDKGNNGTHGKFIQGADHGGLNHVISKGSGNSIDEVFQFDAKSLVDVEGSDNFIGTVNQFHADRSLVRMNGSGNTIDTFYGTKDGDSRVFMNGDHNKINDLNTGHQDDTISVGGEGNEIGTFNTRGGDDTLVLDGSNSKVEGDLGAGDDKAFLHGNGDDVKIDAGEGDDFVGVKGSDNTAEINNAEMLWLKEEAENNNITLNDGSKLYLDQEVTDLSSLNLTQDADGNYIYEDARGNKITANTLDEIGYRDADGNKQWANVADLLDGGTTSTDVTNYDDGGNILEFADIDGQTHNTLAGDDTVSIADLSTVTNSVFNGGEGNDTFSTDTELENMDRITFDEATETFNIGGNEVSGFETLSFGGQTFNTPDELNTYLAGQETAWDDNATLGIDMPPFSDLNFQGGDDTINWTSSTNGGYNVDGGTGNNTLNVDFVNGSSYQDLLDNFDLTEDNGVFSLTHTGTDGDTTNDITNTFSNIQNFIFGDTSFTLDNLKVLFGL